MFVADLYEYHVNGKRHQVQLERYKRRKDESERSVYARGFPPSTQEHELLAYFCMFGPVEKIVYDEKKSMKTVNHCLLYINLCELDEFFSSFLNGTFNTLLVI